MSASTSTDFSRLMEPVALALLGEPQEKHHGGQEWRYGTRGSLSIRIDKGTFFDNEAGTGGGTLRLIKLRGGMDRGAALGWMRDRKLIEDRPQGDARRIDKTYDYQAESGAFLFQVVRYEPKDFRQRRRDAEGAWVWKMQGVRLVPYRLPELIAAIRQQQTIYIAEGEKAVDAVVSLGLPATCSPGGAGKWHRISSAPFADAGVVILPDNDEPGRTHADQVLAALLPLARSVRVVTLPGLPPKGDIADWIAAGGTAAQLEALAAGTAIAGAEVPPDDGAPAGDWTSEVPTEGGFAAPEDEPDDSSTTALKERRKRDRSRAAMRIGAEIRRDDGSFEDMVERLRTDPETADWFQEKGNRNGQRELHRIWTKTEPKLSKRGLPVIYNGAGRLHVLASQAETAIIKSGQPVFQRGQALVRPVVSEVPASRGRTTHACGLGDIKVHALIDLMAQNASWQRWDAKAEAWAADDPNGMAANILLSRAGFWSFPSLAGVITTPTLRPDGSVLLQPGYDAATRLYHAKDRALDLSSLPARPSMADAERALALLDSLLADFPFVGDADRAVALSGMITPIVRGALSVAPLHAVRASTAGTGKSYLIDIASVIATGRICPVASASEDPNETEKRLVGLLLAGYPVVSIDNVNGELGSDLLCQAIERPMVRIRRLGASEIIEIESRATMYATGNALRMIGDMNRRAVRCTLDAGMERPELRTFQRNPVVEVLSNRGRYVAACLTIAMAYQQAGCPDLLPALASFEDWSRLVRSALVWLGEVDPCNSMEAAREDDPELVTLREVLELWKSDIGTGLEYADTVRHVSEKASNRLPTQMGEPTDFALPDLRDALLRIAGVGGTINTRKFGTWLADHEGRIVGGFKFKRDAKKDRNGMVRWAVVKA